MWDETNLREERGREIAKKGEQVRRIDKNRYQVSSQSNYGHWHDVIAIESGWSCTCADHKYRHVCCKHIHAVEFSIKIREEVRARSQTVIEAIPTSKCPHCQSERIVKHGIRHNKTHDLQRYTCRDCNNRFSFNLGFEKMRATPQAITSAMQLYFTGESLRNVQKFLRLQGVEVSHKTVYVWIKKYTKLMEEYLEKITPQVSDVWRADEIYMKVRGNVKYLYAMMDDETRFWIARQIGDRKIQEDVTPLFANSREITGKKPQILITDGAHNFAKACRKEYWRRTPSENTYHIQHIHLKGDKNNNKMERLNGEIRDREKVMRGLKNQESPLISGYQIYHNYVRPHTGLDGATPADKAGIKIEGNNKWITLIQNAKHNK